MKPVAYLFLAIMGLCFILVPVVSYLFGGWPAYWGHAVLAILFSIAIILLKTRYYWEED